MLNFAALCLFSFFAIYLLIRIINFIRTEFFNNDPVVSRHLDDLSANLYKAGKLSLAKEIGYTITTKDRRRSFLKNTLINLLKATPPRPRTNAALSSTDQIVVQTLQKLGFSKGFALAALQRLPSNFSGSLEDKIKELLKTLNTT
jgi:hypothetical protein